MEKLDDKLFQDLLLTKAIENSIGQVDRWESIDDVLDDLFANGEVDRDEYFASIMKLTQLGLVESDIKNEEDLEMAEMLGCDITGVTKEGNEYIDRIDASMATKKKVTEFFDKFNEVCNKINESGAVKLAWSAITPILSLLKAL